jgi:thiamine pyrophosphokinase
MKQVLIIASGEMRESTVHRVLKTPFDEVIAVDGGADHCRLWGFKPDVIVGDLDSLSPANLAFFTESGVLIERHPAQKDETDLELAIRCAIRRNAEFLVLVGVLGGRMDMTIANTLLLAAPSFSHPRMEIWDGESTARILRPPVNVIAGQPGDTLSLIPIGGDASGLGTEGLVYPLKDETLRLGDSRGISNLFSETRAAIKINAGSLLAVHTPGRP